MIFAKHQDALVAVDSRLNLNVVELNKVFSLRNLDGGIERMWDLISSHCIDAVDACGDKSLDICSQGATE